MDAQTLANATVSYLVAVSPFLLIFFAISSADRLVDLVYKAIGAFRNV